MGEARGLSSGLFARFAAKDLIRWRALLGRRVEPAYKRWGEGRVTDVRWESRSEHPDGPGVVYVRIEYADGLRARVNSDAFSRLHSWVSVESSLADFIERAFADRAEPSEAALAEWDRVLRAEQDAERDRRREEVRRARSSNV